jgi:hypothetical protein
MLQKASKKATTLGILGGRFNWLLWLIALKLGKPDLPKLSQSIFNSFMTSEPKPIKNHLMVHDQGQKLDCLSDKYFRFSLTILTNNFKMSVAQNYFKRHTY